MSERYTSLSSLYLPESHAIDTDTWNWDSYGQITLLLADPPSQLEQIIARIANVCSICTVVNIVCAIALEFVLVVNYEHEHLLAANILLGILCIVNVPIFVSFYLVVRAKFSDSAGKESFDAFLVEGDSKACILFWNMSTRDRLLVLLRYFFPKSIISAPLMFLVDVVLANFFPVFISVKVFSCVLILILFCAATSFTHLQTNLINKAELFRKCQIHL
jgi:hypothetical protein